jgi:steroid delta-isomerase-like uncharacterized protein
MKKLLASIPLIVLMCCLCGCQDQAAMAELEAFRAQAELEEKNEAVIRHLIDELNKANIGVFSELYSSDYAYYVPSRNTTPYTRDELTTMFKAFYEAFPDLNWRIEELIAKDDQVAYQFSALGTHDGIYEGIPPTGNRVSGSGIIIARMKDGKVIQDKEEWDTLGWMQQLGMELKPKE